jgi:hypothetical protein
MSAKKKKSKEASPIKKKKPKASQAGTGQTDSEAFFRAFQSNLLSLVSHELRTPLTGVLNALTLLDEHESESGFSSQELISMAKRNADRLHHTLATLLDITSIESGTLAMRFREADLIRFMTRKQKTLEDAFKVNQIDFKSHYEKSNHKSSVPILLEPQKFSRILGLFSQIVLNRAEPKSTVNCFVGGSSVRFRFQLSHEAQNHWKAEWEKSARGIGDNTAVLSLFQGALMNENEFLTRTQEGLGSELWLVHELMKRHQGKLRYEQPNTQTVELIVELPRLTSMEQLRIILLARVYDSSTDLGSVALGLIEIPKGLKGEEFRAQVRESLFRASDSVYFLEKEGRIAIFLNDCKPEDAPRLMGRIEGKLGQKLIYGTAICPEEGTDPDHLVGLAEKRLKLNKKN